MENKKKQIAKINPKGFDPKKYVDIDPTMDDRTMNEEKSKSVVLTFGRFSPPTIGHEKLVNKIKDVAAARKADPMVFTSHTYDKKKNPLTYDQKIHFLQIAFGPVVKKTNARTLIEVSKELSGKYENLIVVVGSDRVPEFQTLLDKYNGKEFEFKTIEVVSAGERDPDADDVSGMSASKLRSLAVEGDFETFKKGLPSKLKAHSKEVYETVLKGMKLMEDFEEDGTLEEKINPLTFMQRLRRSMVMKRYHGKIEAARKRAQNRRASPEKIKDRAQKRALAILRARLSKTKSYGEMSPAEKLALDQRLTRIPQAVINRIATKQIPIVRKAESERFAAMSRPKNESVDDEFEMFLENFMLESDNLNKDYHAGLSKSTIAKRQAHFNKGAAMDDDNPAAYKPAPGDARAKTTPSVHTKRFHRLFNKEGTVKHDMRFKRYKPKVNIYESTESYFEELDDLIESVELIFEEPKEGLKKKAEKTGISYGILKKVFDRGVAAWRTGHRPGTTPEQWGYARVNSFATKGPGTWGKADADLAAKVRKESVDDPCWDGYKQIGMKTKGGKEVPNCVKEGNAMDMARASISREKDADAEKHKNMLDNARRVDSKRKSLTTESSEVINKIIAREKKHKEMAKALKDFSEVVKNVGSEDHMHHAEKVVKSHNMAMTAKDLVKLYHRIKNAKHYEKAYSNVEAWESFKIKIDKSKATNREYGTDSLVRILKSDTPGELDEIKMVPPLKHSKTTVPDFVEPATPDIAVNVSKHNKHHLGVGLNLKQMIQHALKSRDTDADGDVDALDMKAVGDGELVADPSFDQTKTPGEATSKMKKKYEKEAKHTKPGVAFESVDEKFETFLEGKARGFEGKMVDVPNVTIRMANGKLKSLPSGKSSSSDGGGGDGE
jgi:hypothetical protein